MNKLANLVKKLIDISSVSGNEGQIFDFVERFLQQETDSEIIKNKDFVAVKFPAHNKEFRGEKAIILTGHLDTVSAGGEKNWQSSPWNAQVIDKKLVGLGATDMKSAVAAKMLASLDWQEKNQNFDLWFAAVANEEIDGRGSREFANFLAENYQYKKIWGIIGEPTELEKIEIGHRGNRFVKIKFKGVSGHASQQSNFKPSALSSANIFINSISEIQADLAKKYNNPILGAPSLVPTSLHAGDPTSPNRTTNTAEMIIDFRTTPSFDEIFEDFISDLAQKFNFSWEYHSQPVGSSLVDKNSECIKIIQQITGLSSENLVASLGATDQGEFVRRLNAAEIIVFGPGQFDQAHRQDEYILVEKLDRFYQNLLDFLELADQKI